MMLAVAALLIAQRAKEGVAPRAAPAVGLAVEAAAGGRREGSSGEWG